MIITLAFSLYLLYTVTFFTAQQEKNHKNRNPIYIVAIYIFYTLTWRMQLHETIYFVKFLLNSIKCITFLTTKIVCIVCVIVIFPNVKVSKHFLSNRFVDGLFSTNTSIHFTFSLFHFDIYPWLCVWWS